MQAARATGTVRLVARAVQPGGDMDGPMCSSSPTKTIQIRGESSGVQESDLRTYPTLLYKVRPPQPLDLGRE